MGDHIRFIGLEWSAPPDAHIGRLVSTEDADHIIFDRNWLHPPGDTEMNKGIGMIKRSRFIAVINSYLSGFHCVARTGTCTDSSALGGGNGDVPVSTLKIYNNFLEAAGENILFGGVKSDTNPTDIEIRRNHLFKPLAGKKAKRDSLRVTSGHRQKPFRIEECESACSSRRICWKIVGVVSPKPGFRFCSLPRTRTTNARSAM